MVNSDRYFLGIDAGGTKTTAWIVDIEGTKLGEGIAEGANPHNAQLQEVLSNIGAALLSAKVEAEDKVRGMISSFEGSCIGMAGLDADDDRDKICAGLRAGMLRNLSGPGLLLVNDGLICLRGGTDQNYGVSIIAGTGSTCYGILRNGEEALSGDWGFLLGDQGSGFAIGQKLLQQAMREYDGRAEVTGLTEKLLANLNLSGFGGLIRWVYADQLPIREIAGLTQMFEDPEVRDLPVAKKAIEESTAEITRAYESVVTQLSLRREQFPVVLAGGLMNISGYMEKLEENIRSFTPTAEICRQKITPVEGAIRLAREMKEREQEFYGRFLVEWE